ncbi:glutamate racemase [Radicibacter daui]|uniref:glutamate racemase n=1 Tax=Radicibacter daui TaxID=3064829 RepID=UPI004046E125
MTSALPPGGFETSPVDAGMAMRVPGAPAPRVLLVDSGLGGLTVLAACRALIPGLSPVFLADHAAFPYGRLADHVIIERVVSLVTSALLEWPADAVVVACNTASTLVLGPLRERLSVPVVGVVPPIKPAALLSTSRAIGLLATPGTVGRAYVDRLVEDFAADCTVVRVGAPDLAAMAEASMLGEAPDTEEIARILGPFFGPDAPPVDAVALGCTHYPLLLPALKAAAPEGTRWLDPAPAVARRLAEVLGPGAARPAGHPPEGVALVTAPAGERFARVLAAAGLDPLELWSRPFAL